MDVRIMNQTGPRYCDIGPHAGKTKFLVEMAIYMDNDELAEFQKNGLRISIAEGVAPELNPG